MNLISAVQPKTAPSAEASPNASAKSSSNIDSLASAFELMLGVSGNAASSGAGPKTVNPGLVSHGNQTANGHSSENDSTAEQSLTQKQFNFLGGNLQSEGQKSQNGIAKAGLRPVINKTSPEAAAAVSNPGAHGQSTLSILPQTGASQPPSVTQASPSGGVTGKPNKKAFSANPSLEMPALDGTALAMMTQSPPLTGHAGFTPPPNLEGNTANGQPAKSFVPANGGNGAPAVLQSKSPAPGTPDSAAKSPSTHGGQIVPAGPTSLAPASNPASPASNGLLSTGAQNQPAAAGQSISLANSTANIGLSAGAPAAQAIDQMLTVKSAGPENFLTGEGASVLKTAGLTTQKGLNTALPSVVPKDQSQPVVQPQPVPNKAIEVGQKTSLAPTLEVKIVDAGHQSQNQNQNPLSTAGNVEVVLSAAPPKGGAPLASSQSPAAGLPPQSAVTSSASVTIPQVSNQSAVSAAQAAPIDGGATVASRPATDTPHGTAAPVSKGIPENTTLVKVQVTSAADPKTTVDGLGNGSPSSLDQDQTNKLAIHEKGMPPMFSNGKPSSVSSDNGVEGAAAKTADLNSKSVAQSQPSAGDLIASKSPNSGPPQPGQNTAQRGAAASSNLQIIASTTEAAAQKTPLKTGSPLSPAQPDAAIIGHSPSTAGNGREPASPQARSLTEAIPGDSKSEAKTKLTAFAPRPNGAETGVQGKSAPSPVVSNASQAPLVQAEHLKTEKPEPNASFGLNQNSTPAVGSGTSSKTTAQPNSAPARSEASASKPVQNTLSNNVAIDPSAVNRSVPQSGKEGERPVPMTNPVPAPSISGAAARGQSNGGGGATSDQSSQNNPGQQQQAGSGNSFASLSAAPLGGKPGTTGLSPSGDFAITQADSSKGSVTSGSNGQTPNQTSGAPGTNGEGRLSPQTASVPEVGRNGSNPSTEQASSKVVAGPHGPTNENGQGRFPTPTPSTGSSPGGPSQGGGILDAPQRFEMAFMAQNELPGPSLGKNIPVTGKNDSVAALEEASDALQVAQRPSQGTVPLPMEAAEEIHQGSEAGENVELIHEIWSAVERFRGMGKQGWEVDLRPDSETHLNLKMSIQENQLQITARLDQGDWDALAMEWVELQRILAERGIELKPLETSLRSDGREFRDFGNASSQYFGAEENHRDRSRFGAGKEESKSEREQNQKAEARTKPGESSGASRKSKQMLETWA